MSYTIKTLKYIKQNCRLGFSGYIGFNLLFHEDMLSECGSVLSKEEVSSIENDGHFMRVCNGFNYVFTPDMLSERTISWLH